MDDVRIGYDNNSFLFVCTYASPTRAETEAFSGNVPCEIRFVEIDSVIYFTVKLGGLAWMDAPFTPHWYDPKPFLIAPVNNLALGYMLQLSLIDSRTGRTVGNRIIGLGHDFSRQLYKTVVSNYAKPFDRAVYLRSISRTYKLYTSVQLAEKCPDSQRYIAGTKDIVITPDEPVYTDEYPDDLKPWACIPADAPVYLAARTDGKKPRRLHRSRAAQISP